MPSVVDTFPYPWPLPEAQELHRVLVTLYPSEKRALYVAGIAGIPEWDLAPGLPAFDLWRDILNLAAQRMATRKLVTWSRSQSSKGPYSAFFDALLSTAPVELSVEPRNADGSAQFLSGDDTPSEQEALLFGDDLSILVGRVSGYIDTLKRMVELAPAVCLLRVSVGTLSSMGTGFRIADDLLLTNHHVLFLAGLQATRVIAEFGYETDAKDADLTPKPLTCDCTTIVADKEDDWAVIRVKDAMDPAWPRINLQAHAAPVLGERAFILQHPLGGRKRLGFVRNTVTNIGVQTLHYLTDTQQGSSGSPVFNAEGKLIALHHAVGTPKGVAGKGPLMKNEGIRIPRILQGLTSKGVQL